MIPIDKLTVDPCLTNLGNAGTLENPSCTPGGFLDDDGNVIPTPTTGDDDGTITHGRCIELFIVPPSTFAEVGETWQFQAVVKYADQTTQDVTAKALWASAQPEVFSMNPTTGLGTGTSPGIATVSASFCGVTGHAVVEIAQLCVDVALNIVLCMDRSGSMLETESDGQTKLAKAKAAAQGLANVLADGDKMGVVSFAGIVLYNPTTTETEATLDQTLSDDPVAIQAAIESKYVIDPDKCCIQGDCNHIGTRCATGIGGGLQMAWDELASGRHTLGAKQVLVLMTDGANNVVSPDPAVVSAAAKAAGIIVVVIGLKVPTLYNAVLAGFATDGLYFPAPSASDLAEIFSRIPNIICTGYSGYGGVGPSSGETGTGPAAELHGLRWEMPCHVKSAQGHACTCVDPADQSAVMGGAANQLYSVALRIRGLVELKAYEGGSNDGAHLQIGGGPANIYDGNFNEYSLEISDPPQTLYLNRWPPEWSTNAECQMANATNTFWLCNNRSYLVDYQFNVGIREGATVTLKAYSVDGAQFGNANNLVPPGVQPDPAAFDGQFLEMSVIGAV